MTEHGIAYHLTAIAGHLREAGAHYEGAVIALPERQWLKLASRLATEMAVEPTPAWVVVTVGGKTSRVREFTFHGIKYRSLG
jgi:hypothetical protein